MEKKKCEVSQNESTQLPSNCNEVISRYELLQELHRRDQDSEDVVATINDMTAKGNIHGSVILASPELSKSEYLMSTPVVVAIDIMPMSREGVPMAPASTRFLATLEPASCDRLGLMADYVIDVGEKHVVLHRDGSKITNVSIGGNS